MRRMGPGGLVRSLLLVTLLSPAGGWWAGWDSAGPGAATLHRRLLRGGGGVAEEEPGAFDLVWAPASHAPHKPPFPRFDAADTRFSLRRCRGRRKDGWVDRAKSLPLVGMRLPRMRETRGSTSSGKGCRWHGRGSRRTSCLGGALWIFLCW